MISNDENEILAKLSLDFIIAFLLLDDLDHLAIAAYAQVITAFGIDLTLAEAEQQLREKAREPENDPSDVMALLMAMAKDDDKRSGSDSSNQVQMAMLESADSIMALCSRNSPGKREWLDRFKARNCL